jgi:hypothetical protein
MILILLFSIIGRFLFKPIIFISILSIVLYLFGPDSVKTTLDSYTKQIEIMIQDSVKSIKKVSKNLSEKLTEEVSKIKNK